MASAHELAQFPLFSGLPEVSLGRLAVHAEDVRCSAGNTLFHEGDEATHFYVLIKGEIDLRVHLSSRPEYVTVASLQHAGEALGWSGLVPPHHYTASAVCQKDTRLLAFRGAAFMAELENDPEAGFIVMRRVAEIIASRLRNARMALLRTL